MRLDGKLDWGLFLLAVAVMVAVLADNASDNIAALVLDVTGLTTIITDVCGGYCHNCLSNLAVFATIGDD